jgi:hypothetical protein
LHPIKEKTSGWLVLALLTSLALTAASGLAHLSHNCTMAGHACEIEVREVIKEVEVTSDIPLASEAAITSATDSAEVALLVELDNLIKEHSSYSYRTAIIDKLLVLRQSKITEAQVAQNAATSRIRAEIERLEAELHLLAAHQEWADLAVEKQEATLESLNRLKQIREEISVLVEEEDLPDITLTPYQDLLRRQAIYFAQQSGGR